MKLRHIHGSGRYKKSMAGRYPVDKQFPCELCGDDAAHIHTAEETKAFLEAKRLAGIARDANIKGASNGATKRQNLPKVSKQPRKRRS